MAKLGKKAVKDTDQGTPPYSETHYVQIRRRPHTNLDPNGPERAAEKAKFLELFAKYRNPSQCARILGRDRTTVFKWKAADPEFRTKWEALWEAGIDDLEGVMYDNAKKGVPGQNGVITYDSRLQIFLLSKARKEKYGNDIDQQIADLEIRIKKLQALKDAKGMVKHVAAAESGD